MKRKTIIGAALFAAALATPAFALSGIAPTAPAHETLATPVGHGGYGGGGGGRSIGGGGRGAYFGGRSGGGRGAYFGGRSGGRYMYRGGRVGPRVYGWNGHRRGNGNWYRHRRGFYGYPYVYGGYGYSYGGGCYYLQAQALATGSPYWWERYYDCID